MRIRIKEPVTNNDLDLDAQPEDYNGEQGWRIIFPQKDSFVIVQQHGEWNVMDEPDINPLLVEAIGKALHSVARYN
jgi:hypothetical protein